jgi:cellulose synthase/poly-beta-1,6-N-acetylglucosamine synthase-like glycosyltransferase
MTGLILFLVALILYTYFGYLILVLVLGKLFPKKVIKEDIYPTVALMIAAYNEEDDIAAKLENSLALDYPKDKLRIIVTSDGSTDTTDNIVKTFTERGVELIRIEGRVGKTEARNRALRQVDSEIIIFSDATTIYDRNAVKMLMRNFADPKVGMATGQLIYRDPENTQVGIGQRLYWKYETMIKMAQTNLGTLTGSIGCMTAFRREAYTDLPANIIEDFTEPLMFVQKGYRIVFDADAVCYEDALQKTDKEWNMRVRVIRGGMTGMLYARNILNPFKYAVPSFQLISHKILRWLVPVFGILLVLSTFATVLLQPENQLVDVFFRLQMLFFVMAGAGYMMEKSGFHSKVLAIPLYFTLINLASLVALYKTMTSELDATWEKAHREKTV